MTDTRNKTPEKPKIQTMSIKNIYNRAQKENSQNKTRITETVREQEKKMQTPTKRKNRTRR